MTVCWHMDDLTGRVVRDMGNNERADEFEVIEFPAILETSDKKTGKPVQKPLWPEFFDLEALLRTKASMPVFQWNAQYQQNPTGEENAIIPREWWKVWEPEKIPQLEYVIQSYDTAFSKRETADFSAIPHEVLGRIASRIINEVRGISRVTYDISGKPPATIEWE